MWGYTYCVGSWITHLCICLGSCLELKRKLELQKQMKKKENKTKETRKRIWVWPLCEDWNWSKWVLDCFHAWFGLIPHYSFISFGSLATYLYIPYLVLNLIITLKNHVDPYVHVCWLLILEACQVHLMFVFHECLQSTE